MAGLSKEALAAKNAYLAANPEGKAWTDLTDEEKAPWLAGDSPPPKADQAPVAPPAVNPDDLKKLPSGEVVNGKKLEEVISAPPEAPSPPAPAPVVTASVDIRPPDLPKGAPMTDPEHGDLTPAFARWFLSANGREAFNEKYAGRFDLLPADLVS